MRHFHGLVEGIKELKLHAGRRDAFLARLLDASAAAVRDRFTTGHTLFTAASGWARLLFMASIGLVLFALPEWFPVDPRTLTGYTLTLLFAVGPLDSLMAGVPLMSRARIALNKVEALGLSLAAGGSEEDGPGVSGPLPSWERLDLRGVTHSYRREQEDEAFVLGPIDLRLSPGELVFLVGGNGSGKTTLAKLLTGLYAPEEGEILLDGRPVLPGELTGYRRFFSAVFSDFFLFEHLLGLEGLELDARARNIWSCCTSTVPCASRTAGCPRRPCRTASASGWRLLVAYLEDRPICVFDEWAADQDPLFKKVFYTQLLPELKARGKAVVVISHDDHYFHLADRMLKLAEGKLSEEDVSPAILARNGPLVGLR